MRSIAIDGSARYAAQERFHKPPVENITSAELSMTTPTIKLTSLTTPYSLYPLACREGSSDPSVFQQIFIEREYACLDDLVDPRLIIDCGANVGYSAAYFLSRFPSSHVIAVEPDEGNFALLQRNLAPFGARARAIRAAVWSHPTSLKMSEVPYRDGREWARQVRACQPGEPGDLPGLDIGTLLSDSGQTSISVLKIDIEAAEKIVFGSQYESWIGRVENIVIELHDAECIRTFLRAIAGHPFQLSRSGELTVCKRCQQGCVENSVDLLTQAALRHQAGDLNDAMTFYRRLVQLDPAHAHGWYLMGAASSALGLLDEADASLTESLRLRADNADAHNQLGSVRARQGRFAEAIICFRDAIRLQPGHAHAQGNLRNALGKCPAE